MDKNMFQHSPPDFRVEILGSEIEWVLTAQKKDGTAYTQEFEKKNLEKNILSECIPADLEPQNLSCQNPLKRFLLSGDLIYIDSGQHIETATGEGKGPLSMVIYEKRDERLMEEIIRNANKLWEKDDFYLRLFKHNMDTRGQTYGSHENYFLPRIQGITYPLFSLSDNLVPFLITRQLFAGNGRVVILKTDGKLNATYHLSQRASRIVQLYSSSTTSARAVINTRDEPHTDIRDEFHDLLYMRLHLILGDSLLNQAAIFLKFGTTAMVLEMIIHEFLEKTPFGKNSDRTYLSALHNFSADSSLQTVCPFGGENMNMVDIQKFYLKRAVDFYRERRDLLTPEKQKVLSLWQEVLECACSQNPTEALRPYVDWAAKKCWIKSDMKLHKYAWNSSLEKRITIKQKRGVYSADISHHLQAIDLRFHENSPRGYARILEDRGYSLRLVGADVIGKYRTVPIPETTRICARSQILYRADEYAKKLGIKLGCQADWTYVNLKYGYPTTSFNTFLKMPDPRDFKFEWKDPEITVTEKPEDAAPPNSPDITSEV